MLRTLETVGTIADVRHHTRWPLIVNGQKVAEYEDDFNYHDTVTGEFIVEDVKGMVTAMFRLKSKLMKAIYGIAIREVRR